MKAKFLIYCLLAVAVVGVGFSSSQAQSERRGTAGASELLVPVTARTAGYSSRLTSGLDGLNPLEAVLSNPAGMTSGTGTAAYFSRSEYVADIGINYFGIGQTFERFHQPSFPLFLFFYCMTSLYLLTAIK